MSTLIIHFWRKVERVRERTGHLHSYAEAEKHFIPMAASGSV